MLLPAYVWHAILLLLLFGETARLAAICPPFVPIHFDFSGTPDRWGPPSNLFVMPAVAAATTALLLGVRAATPSMARSGSAFLNVPKKDAFLKLPEDARVRVVAPLARALGWIPVVVVGMSWWLVEASAAIAIETNRVNPFVAVSPDTVAGRLSWWPIVLPIVAILVLAIVGSRKTAALIDAEIAKAA
jgi:hypothetical protein